MGVVCTAGRPLTRAVPSHEWSRLLKCLISPFKKIHTNIDSHAHSHTLTWYPWPTTPISRTHRYPAHHPSLYAPCLNRWDHGLNSNSPVLPVHPVQCPFPSWSHRHLCNVCVCVYQGACHRRTYVTVTTSRDRGDMFIWKFLSISTISVPLKRNILVIAWLWMIAWCWPTIVE